ncbi:hypothetical protein SADUNF_Sadunf09G0040400 [Salix dunnii]|uniref:Uncharacterized protein n=1 Tax=Salix dunnii TaxID=1413687 RepID=A0A835MQT5_9ROSI|nr:hypothetical protein SADUNF_Sadunf09G0040400 [Salix dunnii]
MVEEFQGPVMLNTRGLTNDPCEDPHKFFLESVEEIRGNQFVTAYVRSSPHNLPLVYQMAIIQQIVFSKLSLFFLNNIKTGESFHLCHVKSPTLLSDLALDISQLQSRFEIYTVLLQFIN